jgi:hypothetical protein
MRGQGISGSRSVSIFIPRAVAVTVALRVQIVKEMTLEHDQDKEIANTHWEDCRHRTSRYELAIVD